MNWLQRLFTPAHAVAQLPPPEVLDAMSIEELTGLNLQFAERQEAIREDRRKIAKVIDRKLTTKRG